jgi:uncharacterized membrane protein YedE/YeeE
MKIFFAALSGVLFGVGLAVSGMGDPARVLGFLDVTGAWNPSLAFVMGVALLVYALAYRFIRTRKPVLETQLHLPEQKRITPRLLAGAGIFGIGWGLLGYCPGPALLGLGATASLPRLLPELLVFVVAMLGGGILTHLAPRVLHSQKNGATPASWMSSH